MATDKKDELTVAVCRDIEKCTDGGKHDFQGWRSSPDGLGGEQVCKKCGVGAIAWSMRIGQ